MGDYDEALNSHNLSLDIRKQFGDKKGMSSNLLGIGVVYFYKGNYEKALNYLTLSFKIVKEMGGASFWNTTFIQLSYKKLGEKYDKKEIIRVIKEDKDENIEFYINYPLYQLLEDKSYLETAYNQVQEKASAMEDELKAKFLSYPIPKAIVEEWEKVK